MTHTPIPHHVALADLLNDDYKIVLDHAVSQTYLGIFLQEEIMLINRCNRPEITPTRFKNNFQIYCCSKEKYM
jgi:hypothetical protein